MEVGELEIGDYFNQQKFFFIWGVLLERELRDFSGEEKIQVGESLQREF